MVITAACWKAMLRGIGGGERRAGKVLFSSAFPSAAISTAVSTEWAIINTLKDAKYLSCWNVFKKCYIIGLQQSSPSSLYCHHHRETHCSWCKITMCVLAEMLRALMFVFSCHRLAARLKSAASLVFIVLTELWEVYKKKHFSSNTIF